MTTIEKLRALCEKYTEPAHPVYMTGNTLCACDFWFNLRPLIDELNQLGIVWDEQEGYFKDEHMSGRIESCYVSIIAWD